MHNEDPEACVARSLHQFQRRQLHRPGPNYLFHADGFDKLKPFGFGIHGCIDGYSRRIMRLKVIGVGTGRGARGVPPRHFPGRGRGRRSRPLPHFWARTYLKIPPRSLFFHQHNFTALTPNQSVRRCLEKFTGVGPGGEPGTQPPPVYLHAVCVWGGPSCWKPLRASVSVSSDIIFCIISVYQAKNKP